MQRCDRTLVADLPAVVGRKVFVRGWLHDIRFLGKLSFLLVRDRSGLAQVVIVDQETLRRVRPLQSGSILSVSARVASSQEASGGVELVDPEITVEHAILEAPPFAYYRPKIEADLEFILDHRPLALRNRALQAVFRIQAEIAHAYRLYMHDAVGAVEYFPPNLIGTSSEGGAEFFKVDYFNHTATLAQSSQLYKQIMVGVNERVFAIAPFFRAEPSHTTRHLSEGKQFEFEMGFFEDWHELMDIQEGCIKYIVSRLHAGSQKDLEAIEGQIVHCPEEVSFPRLTFREAQELFFQRTGVDERHEPDLSPAAERELAVWARQERGTDCLFVTDWKTEKRPFYAYPNEEDASITNTFDLICAGTEITSGGQRRHTYASMEEGIRLKGMNVEDFVDYLSIFKYGMPPHGGFGMGLERLTMTLLGLKNIREASLFPSDTKRIAANRIKAKIFFGSENIRNEIIRLLRDHGCDFYHFVHDETEGAAEAMASQRYGDCTPQEGVKALVLRGKSSKKNYVFNIAVHRKLNMKACAEAVGEKCEFEDPAVILKRFGIAVGGVPPFGALLNLDNYVDQGITQQKYILFSCGFRTESIATRAQDYLKICEPKIGAFAKEGE